MTENFTTAYCLPEKEQYSDPEQGSIIPVFEKTIDGLTLADPSKYINNGKIHVTKGFNRTFSNSPKNSFYKVITTISSSWNPENSHEGISKYVTYYRNIESPIRSEITMVIDSQYPSSSTYQDVTLNSKFYPLDGLFLKTEKDNGTRVLLGPFDTVKESIEEQNDSYTFRVKTPNRPFGGP